MKEIFIN